VAASNASCSSTFVVADALIINGQGDIYDIIQALNPSEQLPWDTLTPEEVLVADRQRSHCSAIVRLADDMVRVMSCYHVMSCHVGIM
jgi:hypothetical protein